MMKNANTNPEQELRSDDPLWYFLVEFSLSELISDHDKRDARTAGWLSQTVRELGIAPECVENIEMSFSGFTKEARGHLEREKSGSLGSVRVFCQKKMIGDLSAAQSSKPENSGHAKEHAPMLHPTGARISGGWGYFFVERSTASSAGFSGSPQYIIDLYLYKEGE